MPRLSDNSAISVFVFLGVNIDAVIGLWLMLVMDVGLGDWFVVGACDGCGVGRLVCG